MRPLLRVALALVVLLPSVGARGEDDPTSVESSGAVVVHGVTTGPLAARLKAVDRALETGQWDNAVATLDELAGQNLDVLHEDSEGVYLRAEDAVLYRLAALPPQALAQWRALQDPRAAALLAQAGRAAGGAALERDARGLALTTDGPRLLVLLADRRLLRGDLRGAARILEDLLVLWPATRPDGSATPPLPGVARADVVSRLGALTAAVGDASGVRALAAAQPPDLLATPSPALPGVTLGAELAAAIGSVGRRTTGDGIPQGPLRVVAERRLTEADLRLPLPDQSREIAATPAAVTLPDGRPAVLTRVSDAHGISSRLEALTPALPSFTGISPLAVAWSWPSDEEVARFPRPPDSTPFRPVVVGDLVLFAWPSTRVAWGNGERHVQASDDELRDLVVLSLSAEGRVVDERGDEEERRPDGDPELARLSFCGPPLVVGDAVFTTLSGRSPNGGASELHVARFDLVRHGASATLRLRWRRHVVDGSPVPPAQFSATRAETERPLAFPTGMAERFGLLYVGSNTGAVACVDGADGHVVWIETYDRFGSKRATVAEADPVGWKYGSVQIDGDRIVVAPRDSESLLVYAARPLRSRSMRLQEFAVRGAGTATQAGSPLGELRVDELVGVRDGHAYLSGSLPRDVSGAIRWPPAPVIALRLRGRRPGEPSTPLCIPEIPELCAAGGPLLTADGLLFPTFKALYGIPLDTFQGPPRELWRAESTPDTRRVPDRLGNLILHDGRIWSVTPSRVVLFAAE